MNWENECLKSSQRKPTWSFDDHKRALSPVSLRLLPFPGWVPGSRCPGRWRDGPDPPAVQAQCPWHPPAPRSAGTAGGPAGALLPLPESQLLNGRCSVPALGRPRLSRVLRHRPTLPPALYFFVETNSNPVGAVCMVTEFPGSQALFSKVRACCGVWLNFWE